MAQYIYGERIARKGKVVVGCSAIVFDGQREKVLLMRRTANGKWSLPGGATDQAVLTRPSWHNGSMADLERLEGEIRSLSGEELSQFRRWFEEYDWNAWDRQLEADVADGNLDSLADAALDDHEAGRTKPI